MASIFLMYVLTGNARGNSSTPIIGGAFKTREAGELAIASQIIWDEKNIGEADNYQLMEVPLDTSLFCSSIEPLMFG